MIEIFLDNPARGLSCVAGNGIIVRECDDQAAK